MNISLEILILILCVGAVVLVVAGFWLGKTNTYEYIIKDITDKGFFIYHRHVYYVNSVKHEDVVIVEYVKHLAGLLNDPSLLKSDSDE